jgi:hypothetical protein
MPNQFKGTEVHLRAVHLFGKTTGARIRVELQFTDSSGLVHAVTEHELEPSVDPKVGLAAKELYEALRNWAISVHYHDTSTNTERVTARGIAESLRSAADDTDELERQG